MSTINIALVGSGIFARENHIPSIQACPSLNLVAIYSRSLKSAQALTETVSLSGIELYSDDSDADHSYDTLLKRDDIQGLILALPIVSQPAFIKKALAAGKHVLSEKPVAPSIADAAKLLDYSKSQPGHWSVAENFRFLKTFAFARQEIIKLGKVLHFRVKVFTSVTPGGKYFETSWRKTPEYQGGFLLDGGVHFVAGIRELLGGENRPKEVVAFSQLLKEYLPPVDSVDSVWKCESGVTGTVSISFGTSLGGDEYEVACENGSVVVSRDFVTVRKGDQGKGEEEKKEFAYELGGVKAEVAAWAEGIQKGECNVRQSPEEAVADLECLEAMLTSGDRGGEKIVLSKQV